MSLASAFRRVFLTLLPIATILTAYLYLYPIFHTCAFPVQDRSRVTALRDAITQHLSREIVTTGIDLRAPFRLLTLADPQLEGDSALPDPEDAFIPSLQRHWAAVTEYDLDKSTRKKVIKHAVKELCLVDVPHAFQAVRKQIDLFGNDYYLAHIYRTLHWWTNPTHVAVLGDLIGSQWVTDEEFDWRGWRYWHRVFQGGQKISSDEITGFEEPQEIDQATWKNRIINIAGNHDIGYAGDISEQRIDRFENVFGPVNWDIRFRHPAMPHVEDRPDPPSIHVIVLNSLSLDTPALSDDIQTATFEYLNNVITTHSHPVEERTSFTLLLTHLPLHKPVGICTDAPHFSYQDHDDNEGRYKEGGLKEQNHMSEHISTNGILQGLFGMSNDRQAAAEGKGRNSLVLTGHDHEGCDVWHHIPANDTSHHESALSEDQSNSPWRSIKWTDANASASHTGVREVTLRSMMGDYGGNAGLLSLWFDFERMEWQYEIQLCRIGVQHIWWAIHVLDIITVLSLFCWLGTSAIGGALEEKESRPSKDPVVPSGKESTTPMNGKGKKE